MKAFLFWIPLVTMESSLAALRTHNRKKLGGLYGVLHDFASDLRTLRHILMAVLRPSLEHGCEVRNANNCQARALESIQFYALNLQDKIFEIKLIKEALNKRECEEFEMHGLTT